MSLDPLPDTHPHVLGLTIGRGAAHVYIAGDADLAATADLSRLTDSLDLLAYMPIDIDFSDVTFLDSSGVSPLVEATVSRRLRQLPAVRIGNAALLRATSSTSRA